MAGYTSSIEEYNFDHKYRGQALIFIHEIFDESGFKPRNGASQDEGKMRELFNSLDFKVKVYRDLTSKKIIEKLKRAAACKHNKDSDCLVCVFSTHGGQQDSKSRKDSAITWKDCIYGKDCTSILVEDILNYFNEKNCPSLAEKPKLFFMQACRSKHGRENLHYDKGSLIQYIRQSSRNSGQGDRRDSVDELDEACHHMGIQETGGHQQDAGIGDGNIVDIYSDWSEDDDEDLKPEERYDTNQPDEPIELNPDESDPRFSPDSGNIPLVPVELTPIICPDDCLIMYPVMPGRIALRSIDEGSWMIHYLHHNLPFLLRTSRLLPYLTKVSGNIGDHVFRPAPLNTRADILGLVETKVSAILEHRLTKDIRFAPKRPDALMSLWFKCLFPNLLI